MILSPHNGRSNQLKKESPVKKTPFDFARTLSLAPVGTIAVIASVSAVITAAVALVISTSGRTIPHLIRWHVPLIAALPHITALRRTIGTLDASPSISSYYCDCNRKVNAVVLHRSYVMSTPSAGACTVAGATVAAAPLAHSAATVAAATTSASSVDGLGCAGG
jgi:hypothetical protein